MHAIKSKLKKFRRRFGVMAPRVVVRSYFSWEWYVFTGGGLFVLSVLAVWFLFEFSQSRGLGRELEEFRLLSRSQNEELIKLRTTAGTGQSQVRIERAAQQSLATRIQGLERENALLKEDMRLFERLIPMHGEEAQVRIENFRLIPDADGRYRYRLFFAFQPDKQILEFRGRLQFLAIFQQNGKDESLTFPVGRESSAEYVIELKHLLRREGVISIPAGARLKSLEARVLQGDTLKAKRVAQL
jgi:hypothetical protein